jgi:hypothetical protein
MLGCLCYEEMQQLTSWLQQQLQQLKTTPAALMLETVVQKQLGDMHQHSNWAYGQLTLTQVRYSTIAAFTNTCLSPLLLLQVLGRGHVIKSLDKLMNA